MAPAIFLTKNNNEDRQKQFSILHRDIQRKGDSSRPFIIQVDIRFKEPRVVLFQTVAAKRRMHGCTCISFSGWWIPQSIQYEGECPTTMMVTGTDDGAQAPFF